MVIGGVTNGLLVHQDGVHLVYSLGCTIVIEDIITKQQSFLKGHTGVISCIACSSSGRYLASGQVTHMGFKVISVITGK